MTARPIPLEIPNVIFTCIAAGSYHSVAIDHLNRVWTWGYYIATEKSINVLEILIICFAGGMCSVN